jgi:hypothetical protein
MVVFSRDNQEELAFVTACVKQQPLSAPGQKKIFDARFPNRILKV